MTNKEYYSEKIDSEYKKYLETLNIPTKEEWLNMKHNDEQDVNIDEMIHSALHRSLFLY